MNKIGSCYKINQGIASVYGGSRLIISQNGAKNRKKTKLTKDEILMLKVLDDEWQLKGHYWWIFPIGQLEKYRHLFESRWPANEFYDK